MCFFLENSKRYLLVLLLLWIPKLFQLPPSFSARNFSIDRQCWNIPIVHRFALTTSMKGTRAVHRHALTCSDPPLVSSLALQKTQLVTTRNSTSLSPWWPKSPQLQWDRPSSCSVHSARTQRQHPPPRKCAGTSYFLHFLPGSFTNVEIEDPPNLPPWRKIWSCIFSDWAKTFTPPPAALGTSCCCWFGV